LPKKRGAIAPQGFTRRYGNIIAARIPIVGRDGLDACVYKGTTAPVNKAPPPVAKKPRPLPGEEFETAKPPPPADTSDVDEPAVTEPPAAQPAQVPEQPGAQPTSTDQTPPGNAG
jgi:monofunctional biosynthetic peptidoglycan transglycosylase